MKVDGLLKEIIKEETKVRLEFNYLEMIVFVMNPLMARHKLATKKGHIMRWLGQAIPEAPQPKPQVPPQRTRNKYGSGRVRGMEGVHDMDKAEHPEGHQDQEQADPELSIAEIQEICEVKVLAMSGRAGAGASSIPKCPACGKGRHNREDCWVLHPHKAPEWLQDKLKSKKTEKGSQAKPPAHGGGKGKGSHKGGKFPPCKSCGSALHPPEDCWTLHPELREKAKPEGRLGKRHHWENGRQRWKSKKIDQAGRDMGPSPATLCPIMWVNQAQAWDDGYCTRPVLRINGAEEEIWRVPGPGHAERLPKGVIVTGIYIPHKGTSERIEAFLLGNTGNEVIVVAGWELFPEQFREVATQLFRLHGVGETELEGGKYVVRSDIIVPVQRGSQVVMVRCADFLVFFGPG